MSRHDETDLFMAGLAFVFNLFLWACFIGFLVWLFAGES